MSPTTRSRARKPSGSSRPTNGKVPHESEPELEPEAEAEAEVEDLEHTETDPLREIEVSHISFL